MRAYGRAIATPTQFKQVTLCKYWHISTNNWNETALIWVLWNARRASIQIFWRSLKNAKWKTITKSKSCELGVNQLTVETWNVVWWETKQKKQESFSSIHATNQKRIKATYLSTLFHFIIFLSGVENSRVFFVLQLMGQFRDCLVEVNCLLLMNASTLVHHARTFSGFIDVLQSWTELVVEISRNWKIKSTALFRVFFRQVRSYVRNSQIISAIFHVVSWVVVCLQKNEVHILKV